MTPKMTALRNTLGVFAAGIAGGLVMAFIISTFTLAQIGIAFLVVGLLILAHLVYELELDKAKRLQELNNLKG